MLQNNTIREHLLFYPNTSVYRIGAHYRYVEYYVEKKRRVYTLEGIAHNSYIEKILEESKKGKTIQELATLLVNKEITLKEANGFIEQLIQNQLLVSELEITVTGEDYLENLMQRIQQIPSNTKISTQLMELQTQLREMDTSFGNPVHIYERLIQSAKKLVPEFETKYLLQTDCFATTTQNTLHKRIQKSLKKALVLFNKITLPTANANLEEFKRAYLKRFEQTEVPLSIALDSETGIGFGTKKTENHPLLEDIPLTPTKKRYKRMIWADVDSILQQKLIACLQENQDTLSLSLDDFKELPTPWNDLPDTISSLIEVYPSEEAEKVYIKNIGGASATCLLGRFSYGDKNLLEHVQEIVALEEQMHPDKVLAEIVHLPQARTGNILHRPTFRKYEIPYLGKSNVPSKHQIPIEDILVSVKNDRIVLHSKKYNKEILPRLSNAHNFGADPLPLYQFLCELQTQNKQSSIGFRWHEVFKQYPFLPRVTFENLILSKAQWRIEVTNFKKNIEAQTIKKWQKTHRVPNLVELVEGDNKLLIDFTHEMAVKMLWNTVKDKKYFVLDEFLFTEEGIVNKNDEAYCNQFVISFYNQNTLKQQSYV